jgi:Carboxypeptidase regulatory-like domain
MNNTRLRLCRSLLRASVAGATLAIVPLMPTIAHAQGYSTVRATGRVIDQEGKPIVGASVAAKSEDQGFSRTATTDKEGNFSLPELQSGSYSFSISASGYPTYEEAGIRISANNSSNVFALSAETNNEIVVKGSRVATVDFDRTTTGLVLDLAEVSQRLPIARNIQSVIQLAPGATAGSSAFSGLSSINGGAVSENAFFVNGLNITDFRKGLAPVEVPYDFYQTVETKTGGYAAEFGRSTGGFINATTKSGSNEFHGSMLYTWNPNSLRSKTKDTIYSDNGNGSADSKSLVATLSGPIWKDHLFFFGLYQARDNNSVGAGTEYDLNTKTKQGTSRSFYHTGSPFFGGKVDAYINDQNHFEFTYFDTSGESTYQTYGSASTVRFDRVKKIDGPFVGASYGSYGGRNYVGRYTSVVSDWLTFSAAYGRGENDSSSRNVNADSKIVPSVYDARVNPGKSLTVAGGGVYVNNDVRKFYRADVDVYANFLGTHHIKFGYDREELSSENRSVGSGLGYSYTIYRAKEGDQFGLPIGTDYVRQTYYSNIGSFTSKNEAFYIQDAWALIDGRLNLNLGLRDDRFLNNNSAGQRFYRSGDQLGPRLGFTFDPFGARKDKIYGSFSRLFLPVASNTNIRLTGGETYYTRTNLLAGIGADGIPTLGAPVSYAGASACPDDKVVNCDVTGSGQPVAVGAAVSQSLKPQSQDEFILGYEKRIDRWRFNVYGMYTKLNNVLEDAAIDRAVNNYCTSNGITGCDKIWTGFTQYVLINPGSPVTVQLAAPINGESSVRTVTFTADQLGYPTAKRTYKGLVFEVGHEFDGHFELNGSYVLSWTKGNYEGGVKTDNGQSDTGLTTDFDQPGLTNGTYGYSPNDRRHVFKLWGSYAPTENLTIGFSASATSPRHYGCIGQVPASVDPYARAYGAAGLYCRVLSNGQIDTDPTIPASEAPVTLIPRGSVFTSDWVFGNDLSIAWRTKIGKSEVGLNLTVFNALNLHAKTDFNEYGTDGNGVASPYYQQVTGYQTARSARLQAHFSF